MAIGFKRVANGESSTILAQQNSNPANPEDKYTYLEERTEPLTSTKTVINNNTVNTTLYVFENMQQPNANLPKTDAEWNQKVPGINSTDNPALIKQQYKAKWADEKAVSVYIRANYTTVNGGVYAVAYQLHIGSDVISNYEVKRNNHYEINIKVNEERYERPG